MFLQPLAEILKTLYLVFRPIVSTFLQLVAAIITLRWEMFMMIMVMAIMIIS